MYVTKFCDLPNKQVPTFYPIIGFHYSNWIVQLWGHQRQKNLNVLALTNMVNHAHWMSVKKFFDLPNKLIPIINVLIYAMECMLMIDHIFSCPAGARCVSSLHPSTGHCRQAAVHAANVAAEWKTYYVIHRERKQQGSCRMDAIYKWYGMLWMC